MDRSQFVGEVAKRCEVQISALQLNGVVAALGQVFKECNEGEVFEVVALLRGDEPAAEEEAPESAVPTATAPPEPTGSIPADPKAVEEALKNAGQPAPEQPTAAATPAAQPAAS